MTASRTVLVTGAAGGIGRFVVDELSGGGWKVLAADRVGGQDLSGVAARLTGDLRDPAFVTECFAGPAARELGGVDAVVHMAAIPAPGIVAEHETLLFNAGPAYLVHAEAGRRGGRIVASSSFSAVGLAWADRDLSPDFVPVDEQHPRVTVDPYGLSMGVTEQIAAQTTRRFGVATVCLRFPFVGTGARLDHRLAEVHADPAGNRRELWAWVDTRDAARAVHAALTADLTGHHVLNIAAPDTTALEPTRELLDRFHPGATVRSDLAGHDSLIDTRLAEKVLGFSTEYGWRNSGGAS